MRPGTALVQAYLASRLSPTAPPAHPFPLSVPKLRAFVARDALRTANGRTDHRPKASGHDDPQSARRLPVGQELVIAHNSRTNHRARRCVTDFAVVDGSECHNSEGSITS